MTGIVNHLWQSTLFATLTALVAIALRHHHARTRHALWLAASMKFLLPFSLLVSLGSRVEVPVVAPGLPALAVEQITTSFAPAPVTLLEPHSGAAVSWPMVLGTVWFLGASLLSARWGLRWLLLRRALKSAVALPLAVEIPVLSTATSIEPGVFGILRPVLLLPYGISSNLTGEELEAILSHELAHVRRHDNLTAAFHMLVETLFWFHPLVWWIGHRLVEERERACDEAVLAEGRVPQIYAQGILNVCKFYVASPLVCASGVSGSDLRRRIEQIMTSRTPLQLTLARACLLAAVAIAAVSFPIALGILRAQTLPPPPQYKFEVASIRPGDPSSDLVRIMPGPQGGLRTQNSSTLQLITFAYDLRDFQITGAPAWLKTEKFNVTGTPDQPEEAPSPGMPREKMETMFSRQRQRMQALLIERFGLVLRAETREMPIYALTLARSGSKLKPSADEKKGPQIRMQRGHMMTMGATPKMIAAAVSQTVGRAIVDETGLTGVYDVELEWTPDAPPGESGGSGTSIFTALQDQLGLKLESKKGPVPVFVIEKIERPSEN